jgi:hypothetical protein
MGALVLGLPSYHDDTMLLLAVVQTATCPTARWSIIWRAA